jgi:hypothetical protein
LFRVNQVFNCFLIRTPMLDGKDLSSAKDQDMLLNLLTDQGQVPYVLNQHEYGQVVNDKYKNNVGIDIKTPMLHGKQDLSSEEQDNALKDQALDENVLNQLDQDDDQCVNDDKYKTNIGIDIKTPMLDGKQDLSSEEQNNALKDQVLDENVWNQLDQDDDHIVNDDKYMVSSIGRAPELFRIFENHDLWQRRYIKQDIIETLSIQSAMISDDPPTPNADIRFPNQTYHQSKCPDVWILPMFTETFAQDILNGIPEGLELWQANFESDWKAILNFYLIPRFMEIFKHGQVIEGGHFSLKKFKEEPDIDTLDEDVVEPIRLILPLTNCPVNLEFKRQNVTISSPEKGTFLALPGRITHPFKIVKSELSSSNKCSFYYIDSLLNTLFLWTHSGHGDKYGVLGHIMKPVEGDSKSDIQAFMQHFSPHN